MKKNVARPRHQIRPSWKPRLLSQAIAMATAGLQASAALASCPGTQANLTTSSCSLGPGESLSVTTTGAIVVPPLSTSAAVYMFATAEGGVTVNNSGLILNDLGPLGILAFGEAGAAVNITNNDDGVILGAIGGVAVGSPVALTLNNAGVIGGVNFGPFSGTAFGVLVDGPLSGSITNSGVIRANAYDTSGSAGAVGVRVGSVAEGSSISNSGTISAEASASSSEGFVEAFAAGLASSGTMSGTLSNDGSIVALASASSSARAAGIFIGGNLDGALGVSNTGSITASADAFSADAVGINVDGNLNGTITTGGSIAASASAFTANAAGIRIGGNMNTGASLTNTGGISATAGGFVAAATGIDVGGGLFGASIDNALVYDAFGNVIATGHITASASGFSARAAGIFVSDTIATSSAVTNEGTIAANADGFFAQAGGIVLDNAIGVDGMEGMVANSGSIDAFASAAARASAAGIYINDSAAPGSVITNSGFIGATALASESAAAYGINLDGDLLGGAVSNNQGTISATANANGRATATGINVNGSINAFSFTTPTTAGEGGFTTVVVPASLTNSGSITATAGSSEAGVNFASAAGIRVNGSISEDATLSNSGSISASATATSAAFAVGIDVNGFVAGSISNDGSVAANATGFGAFANATGVQFGPLSGSFTNGAEGSISAVASATQTFAAVAFGVRASGSTSGSISNSGAISATANVTSALGAAAYGLHVSSLSESGTITNGGSISATANATDALLATAQGVTVDEMAAGASIDVTKTATTTGSITAVANNTFLGTETSASIYATAFGVHVATSLKTGSSITNAGTISATATAHGGTAYADADGILIGNGEGAMTGTLSNNSGTITAVGVADFSADVDGIDIQSSIVGPGTLTNGGTINAEATSGFLADATGIEVNGGLRDLLVPEEPPVGAKVETLIGSHINATATGEFGASATGIYVSSTIEAASSITNGGTISANANGGFFASAVGIFADEGALQGQIVNDGTINAHADAGIFATATGIYLSSAMASGSKVTNGGTINASAIASESAYAAGIQVNSSVQSGATLTNGGTINAFASATTYAHADGILVDGALGGTLLVSNSGTINATAVASSAASAHGIVVVDSVSGEGGTLTNEGHITATARATSTFGSAQAIGVYAVSDVLGTISNTGSITASATSGLNGAEGFAAAAGIVVEGALVDGASVVNGEGGVINVTAKGLSSAAVGIAAASSVQSGASLINDGTITVTAHRAGLVSDWSSLGNLGAAGIGVAYLEDGAELINNGTITANIDQGINGLGGTGAGWAIYVNSAGGTTEGSRALVVNNGTLNGNVHLMGTSLDNTGTISLPVSTGSVSDTSFVEGDFVQTGGGTLKINAFDYDNYGRIVVGGEADITGSGKFVLNAKPNHELLYAGTLQNVLTGETALATGTMTVTDNIPLWKFTALNDGENGVDLVVSGDMANVVTATGPSWAVGAASGIDAAANGGEYGEDMADVIAALARIPTNAELAAAATQLVPVLIGRGIDYANQSLSGLWSLVNGRMDTHRGMTDQTGHDQDLWVRAFGTSGEQDDDQGYPGYDTENYGIVIGYDRNVGENWNIGGAFSYSQPKADMSSNGLNHKIESDSYQGALYGYWTNESKTFVDLMGIYGQNSNDSSRDILIQGLDARRAEASYDTSFWRLSAAVGHDFALSDTLTLTPSLNVAYTYVEDDSYTEHGAGDLSLMVDDNDVDSLVSGLDLRLAYQVMDNGVLTAHVGAAYDSMTDDTILTSAYVGGGGAWQTGAPEPDDTIIRAGVGAEFNATDSLDLHLSYDYMDRDSFTDNLVTGTMRWKI